MTIIEKLKNIFRPTDANRHTGDDYEDRQEEHRVVFREAKITDEEEDHKTPHVNANFSSVNIHLANAGGKYAEANILSMPNPSGSMTSQGAKKDEGEELVAESKTNILRHTKRQKRGNRGISRGTGRR